ncbi:MAG TPA: PDZ domain-containing protein, partial [Lacipirellulaceae bacterium]|nr:PDZ domain-containing protein [Lacipirellulaceae bacterium]
QLYYVVEGAPIDDAVAKMFATKKKLAFVKFENTKVTPAAVDALKRRHPEAIVILKNQALLGVMGQNNASGVMVAHVQPNTSAAAAGIAEGDIITAIDGHAIPDFDRLTAHIAQHQPGDKIEVEILRGEKKMKLSVTLGSWEKQG